MSNSERAYQQSALDLGRKKAAIVFPEFPTSRLLNSQKNRESEREWPVY